MKRSILQKSIIIHYTFSLILSLLPFSLVNAQYSLYVGQAQFLSPPNTEGYIDYANWYASGNIIFTSQDPYGAIIEISEYFTGTATVSMSYVERYFK